MTNELHYSLSLKFCVVLGRCIEKQILRNVVVISSYDHIITSSYHRIITSSHHHIIIPYHQIIPSQCCRIGHHTARSVSRFWPKSQPKNGNRPFYPSAKSHTELKLSSSGVFFRDGSAKNAQKIVAPPKRLVLDLTPNLFAKFS